MAQRAASVTADRQAHNVTWSGLATGDTGESYPPEWGNPLAGAVQVEGTFGGATVTLQRSNDGTNWHTVKDLWGADIALTAAGMKEFSTAARYLRPSVSGGAGTGLAVTLCLRG